MKRVDARSGLEMLSEAECQEHLTSQAIGRLAVVAGHDPEIFPVNYVMDGPNVAFRTAAGTKFNASVRSTRVAFEIDGFDEETRSGWSVIVRGRADEVLSSAERLRLDGLGLRPWADGERDIWLVIRPEVVTGRRVGAAPDRFASG